MKELKKLNLKNKKYIIFDSNGTLLDSVNIWNRTDQKLIQKYSGLTIDCDVIKKERNCFTKNCNDNNVYLSYCKYLIEKYDFTIKNKYKLNQIRTKITNKYLENETNFKPNVVKLILKLKQLGYVLILATMSKKNKIDIYTKRNKKMIEQMNITETFDLIITTEDIQKKKPDPEIYNKIMEHYNAKPEECLIFEDSLTGVLAAKNANIEIVNVYDKYADVDREEINKITDYSINNYQQIIELLKGL